MEMLIKRLLAKFEGKIYFSFHINTPVLACIQINSEVARGNSTASKYAEHI